MGPGSGKICTYALVGACLISASITALLLVIGLAKSHETESYVEREARVVNLTQALTRCDPCVNSFLDDSGDENHDDDDDDDGGDGDEVDDGDGLVSPEWWTSILTDPDKLQAMEDSCPLISALYVIVEYEDENGVTRHALLHENIDMKEEYAMLSFSNCEDPKPGRGSSRRRQRRQARESTVRTAAALYGDLLTSGEPITVYASHKEPDQAIEDDPRLAVYTSAAFLVPLSVTFILVVALVVRLVVVCKRKDKVGAIKKWQMYVVDERAATSWQSKEQLEKDPRALGPEVAADQPEPIQSKKTLMTHGLADSVAVPRQAAVHPMIYSLPPVYDEPTSPPPSYSSVDLSKY